MPFWASAQLQPYRYRLALIPKPRAGWVRFCTYYYCANAVSGAGAGSWPPRCCSPVTLSCGLNCSGTPPDGRRRVIRLVMDGVAPAVVPDAVVVALKGRELDGLIELPVPPRFQRGDRVRIRHGAFVDRIGLVAGMKPHERVEVLLSILGGHQRVTLPVGAHVDDEPPVAV